MIGKIAIFSMTALLLLGCSPSSNDNTTTTTDNAAIDRVYDYNCGNMSVRAVYHGEDTMTLYVDGMQSELESTISASGARYATPSGTTPEIVFWSKGNEASLEREGYSTVECVEASGRL